MLTKAFTLIELLIACALVAVVASTTLVITNRFVIRQAHLASADQLATVLKKAHVFAREAKDDTAWGMVVTSETNYVLARGQTDNWTQSGAFQLKSPIIFAPESYPMEIWFGQGTGYTEASAEVTVVTPADEPLTITVSQLGVVEGP